MKKILPYFLIFVCSLPIIATANTNRITKIFENNYFFDSTDTLHKIEGIIIPAKNNDLWCHQHATHKFLQEKIRYSHVSKTTESTFFLDQVDVRKILLAEGFAKIDYEKISNTDLKNLRPFQLESFIQKKNIWKLNCNDNRKKVGQIKISDDFKITVGRVKNVLNGNSFQLKNGPIIQIDHTKIPNFSDKSPAATCFKQESKKFLEHQLLDKLVQLKSTNTVGTNPKFKVFRSVEILNASPFQPNDLAEILIKNGYTKHKNRHQFIDKKLSELQTNAYKKPAGAWSTCSKYVFGELKNDPSSKNESNTEDCPIKGNISGSKKAPVKTFHTPDSGWYNRLQHEACFKTEDEAINAGFKKVK